jgi:hypothetical protein
VIEPGGATTNVLGGGGSRPYDFGRKRVTEDPGDATGFSMISISGNPSWLMAAASADTILFLRLQAGRRATSARWLNPSAKRSRDIDRPARRPAMNPAPWPTDRVESVHADKDVLMHIG